MDRTPTNDELRDRAFKLYCRIGNLAQVARDLSLRYGVVHGWSTKYEWKKRRESVLLKLKFFLDMKELGKDNEHAHIFQAEVEGLEYLQSVIADAMVKDDLKPRTFKEAMFGLDIVLKRKHEIFSLIERAKANSISNGSGNGVKRTLTAEEELAKELVESKEEEDRKRALGNAISNSGVPTESS